MNTSMYIISDRYGYDNNNFQRDTDIRQYECSRVGIDTVIQIPIRRYDTRPYMKYQLNIVKNN